MDYWVYYLAGIVLIPGILFSLWASYKVNSTFQKYRSVPARSGVSASRMAVEILSRAGIYDVEVVRVSGSLTDYYDHRNRRIALSDSVYASSSVAALGVAAHECGHAIQYAKDYAPVKIRAALVPVVNLTSTLLWPVLLIGMFLGFTDPETPIGKIMLIVAIAFFGASILFSLFTLPTELDASRRANAILTDIGALASDEAKGAKKVLSAAAMTYLAALIMSILSLVRILIVFFLRSRRR